MNGCKQMPKPVNARVSDYINNLRNINGNLKPIPVPNHIIIMREVYNYLCDNHTFSETVSETASTIRGINFEIAIDHGQASHFGAKALQEGKTVQLWK